MVRSKKNRRRQWCIHTIKASKIAQWPMSIRLSFFLSVMGITQEEVNRSLAFFPEKLGSKEEPYWFSWWYDAREGMGRFRSVYTHTSAAYISGSLRVVVWYEKGNSLIRTYILQGVFGLAICSNCWTKVNICKPVVCLYKKNRHSSKIIYEFHMMVKK